jgi:hypothetical protein
MKKQVLIVLLVISSLSLFAQDKVALTKEETVNYINKKMIEVCSQWVTDRSNSREYISEAYVSITKDCNLYFSNKRANKSSDFTCGDWTKERKYIFNPAHIVDITDEELPTNQALGFIKVKLISLTGKLQTEHKMVVRITNPRHEQYNQCNYNKVIDDTSESCQFVYIPYLKSDPTNFNKIKKAFEHLKDLCKSEDDPFGE